jgi:membrane protease YdiL (CAAX protease family)
LSVVFSLIHGNPFWLGAIGWFAFFNRFFLGIATSGLRIRYGSLLPSFAAHATLNGLVCIAAMTEQGA